MKILLKTAVLLTTGFTGLNKLRSLINLRCLCVEQNFTKPGEQEAARCDTRSKLKERGCKDNDIISPENDQRIDQNTPLSTSFSQQDPVQLSPQRISLRLRPGEFILFVGCCISRCFCVLEDVLCVSRKSRHLPRCLQAGSGVPGGPLLPHGPVGVHEGRPAERQGTWTGSVSNSEGNHHARSDR